MTFTEFTDYVLVRLYELGGESGQFHNVNQMAAELLEPVPHDWASKATTALENMGFVTAAVSMLGAAGAVITGDGMLYVEGRRHETSVIDAYRVQPSIFINVAGDANQLAVTGAGSITQAGPGARGDTAEIVEVLGRLAEGLRGATLDQDELAEYLAEVETAKRQVTKASPNFAAAAALLEPLAKVAAVAELVQEVLRLLGHG